MFQNLIDKIRFRKKPEPVEHEPSTYWAAVCENCQQRYLGSRINFCPECGNPVKWYEFSDEDEEE